MWFKTSLLIIALLAIIITWYGNSEYKDPVLDKGVAKVNNYIITVRDFKQEARALNPVLRNMSSIPPETLKNNMLDDMIQRELLLEEAQKMNIDKNDAFMHEVENFWRLALIKELIVRKTQELAREINEPDKALKRQKVQMALDQWAEGLRSKAVIEKYQDVISGLPVSGIQGDMYGNGKKRQQ